MPTEVTYYKNSNTGELVMKQHFITDTRLDFPDLYYGIIKSKPGVEDFDLTGFVEISQKKYQRERRKQLRDNPIYLLYKNN